MGMALYTLDRFSTIFYMGDNFCNFLFAFLHTSSPSKKVFLKNKEFAPQCVCERERES